MNRRARAFTSFVVALAITSGTIAGVGHVVITRAAASTAHVKPKGPCADSEYRVGPHAGLVTRTKVGRRQVVCAFAAIVPGARTAALQTAYRESRYDPWAHNTSSDARGLFQHLERYWPGRRQAFLHESWFPNTWPHVGAYNGRANALVAAIMWRIQGGPCPAWC